MTDLEPMSMLHVDLFQFGSKHFISVRDQLITYTWISLLGQPDTEKVLNQLDHIQAKYGRCSKLVTDHGSQFKSKFDDYCKKKKIQHDMSVIYSPSLNAHSDANMHLEEHN